MRIGVPKEIKVLENRVGLAPGIGARARAPRACGDRRARRRAGHRHRTTRTTGAQARRSPRRAADVFARRRHDRQGEGAAGGGARDAARRARSCSPICTSHPIPSRRAISSRASAVCIAYETVTSAAGGLPLLAPMSEVAGRMAVQAGAYFLEKPHGGKGVLLGGVPGVAPAKVVVLGGGVVGTHAIEIALGMGARRHGARPQCRRAARLWTQYGPSLQTVFSTRRCDRAPRRHRRPRHRRRAGAGRRRAEARHARDDRDDASRARSSSTSPSTRAAASRRRTRRRTPSRRTSSTASSTTASRTCRAACRARRRSRSTTRRCRSSSRSPTRAGNARSPTTCICGRDSTSRSATSRAGPSPTRSATRGPIRTRSFLGSLGRRASALGP